MYPLISLLLPVIAAGAAPVADCRTDFDSLQVKVDRNYPGVVLELTDDTQRRRYAEHSARLANRASAARSDSACFAALRDFVGFWKDEHLFVFQSARLDTLETARRVAQARAEARPLDEAVVAGLLRPARGRDPIVGIWRDRALRVAIVPDGERQFVAVILAGDSASWEPGMVRGRARRRADGGYDLLWREASHQERWLEGHLVGSRLRMPPHLLAREFAPDDPAALAVNPASPRAPALYWRDTATAVLVLPSMEFEYRGALQQLLVEHVDRLRRAERLVIDMRGNVGGSSAMVAPLAPFVLTDSASRRPPRVAPWRPLMIASPENEALVRRDVPAGKEAPPAVAGLLSRMRSNPGALVPWRLPSELPPEPNLPAPPPGGPAEIVILADRLTVSAAETILLEALRSPRVRFVGTPTGGVLDYGNVSIVRLREGNTRWFLGYPTIVANDRVPAEGIRGRGVQPDVVVDLATQDDAVGAALEPLRRAKGARR